MIVMGWVVRREALIYFAECGVEITRLVDACTITYEEDAEV